MSGRLAAAVQTDFSAGAVRAVSRDLIPENGCYSIFNGLLNNDGKIYKRGGSEILSTSDFGTVGLRWVRDLNLTPGRRTVFADTSNFGVLDGSEAPLDLGGSGLTAPVQSAVLKGALFIGGGTIYGGSRKTANYSTGTVTATNGSAVLTGSGTSWTANVDAGMLFRVSGERCYVVQSVDSNTQITLTEQYAGTTGAGKSYTLKQLEDATTTPYRTADIYAVGGERMFACSGNYGYFSNFQNPHVWDSTDYHQMPEGGQILGAMGLDTDLFYFTTEGIVVASNLHFELTDDFGNPQHQVRFLTRDVILWSAAGITTWNGNLIVPAIDGVWTVGPDGYTKISKPIAPLYEEYVRDGYQTGGAQVYNGHLFLPVIDGSANVIDTLVCRLDRPVNVRGEVVFPWSFLDGEGANVTCFTQRVSTSSARSPKLLGAGRAGSGSFIGRVLDLSGYFAPTDSNTTEHDASQIELEVETRDYTTGDLNKNLLKHMRLTYRLVDAATDNPTISAAWSVGALQTSGSFWGVGEWGSATWTSDEGSEFYALAGVAPEDDGREPYVWAFSGQNARTRYVRFKFRNATPAEYLELRSVEVFKRQSRRL